MTALEIQPVQDWRARALCAGADPRMWDSDNTDPNQRATAEQICGLCPVRVECEVDASPTDRVHTLRAVRAGEQRRCAECSEDITGMNPGVRYCSTACRELAMARRMYPAPAGTKRGQCVICETPLTGNQLRYCGRECRNRGKARWDRLYRRSRAVL